jgi:DedD protein
MRLPFTKTRPADAPADADDTVPAGESLSPGKPVSPGATRAAAAGGMSTSTRRRLMGAFVLLVAGVVGFPLLFDSQPRPTSGAGARSQSGEIAPLPSDSRPIETAQRPGARAPTQADSGGAAPNTAAGATGQGGASVAETGSAPVPGSLAPPPSVSAAPATGARVAAGAVVAGAAVAAATAAAVLPPKAPAKPGQVAQATVAVPDVAPSPPPAAKPTKPLAPATAALATPPAPAAPAAPVAAPRPAAAPAKVPVTAALATAPVTAAAEAQQGRFVVQVGAFADPKTLREARDRVEKLGLKTYTQVVDTPGGKRTRVRVGPYASRAVAEAAAAKLKAGGMPGALLEL